MGSYSYLVQCPDISSLTTSHGPFLFFSLFLLGKSSVWLFNCVVPALPQDIVRGLLSKINQRVSASFVFVIFVLTLNNPVENRSQADWGKVWGSSFMAGLRWGRLCLQEACCRWDVKHTSSCLTSVSSKPHRAGLSPNSPHSEALFT